MSLKKNVIFYQAKFVEGMLEGTQNLRNGFYIEAGAYDGVKFSNSLLFELRSVMCQRQVSRMPFSDVPDMDTTGTTGPGCSWSRTRRRSRT